MHDAGEENIGVAEERPPSQQVGILLRARSFICTLQWGPSSQDSTTP